MSAFSSNNWRQPVPAGTSVEESRHQSASEDVSIAEGHRIYLGNLDYTLTPDYVEQFFSDAGMQAAKIHMSVDAAYGRNPGYCFVEFHTKEVADQALEQLPGAELSGRQVKVGPCKPKRADGQARYRVQGQERDRPWQREGGHSHWNRGSEGGRSYGRGPRGDAQDGGNGQRSRQWQDWQPQSGARNGQGRDWQSVDAMKKTVYVGGLPRQESSVDCEAGLQDLFKEFAVESISKSKAPNVTFQESGALGNNYFCFVRFASEEDAVKALDLNGVEFQGVRLRVSAAKGPKPRDGAGGPRSYERESGHN